MLGLREGCLGAGGKRRRPRRGRQNNSYLFWFKKPQISSLFILRLRERMQIPSKSVWEKEAPMSFSPSKNRTTVFIWIKQKITRPHKSLCASTATCGRCCISGHHSHFCHSHDMVLLSGWLTLTPRLIVGLRIGLCTWRMHNRTCCSTERHLPTAQHDQYSQSTLGEARQASQLLATFGFLPFRLVRG